MDRNERQINAQVEQQIMDEYEHQVSRKAEHHMVDNYEQQIDKQGDRNMNDAPSAATGPNNIESSVQTRHQAEHNGAKQVNRIIHTTAKARRNIDLSSTILNTPSTPLCQPQTPSVPPSTTTTRSSISEYDSQRNYHTTTISSTTSPLPLKSRYQHQGEVEITQAEHTSSVPRMHGGWSEMVQLSSPSSTPRTPTTSPVTRYKRAIIWGMPGWRRW
ncbi:hypothetical protein GE09DRAFT_1232447 [Coniochaeta sp. 2T2.1]|nr:hypothetical protein GE09DRAFT_1232447 [Coniochaeta sp. 2T2.1]